MDVRENTNASLPKTTKVETWRWARDLPVSSFWFSFAAMTAGRRSHADQSTRAGLQFVHSCAIVPPDPMRLSYTVGFCSMILLSFQVSLMLLATSPARSMTACDTSRCSDCMQYAVYAT
jgi:hypothetical protein